MKYIINIFLAISLILFTGCQNSNASVTIHDTSSIVEYSDTQEFFSVPISIKAYGENSKNAVNLAFQRVAELEKVFSNTLQDSEVSKINSSAYLNAVEISNDMQTVLNTALYYSNVSNGAFDFTINNLINLWGIGTDNPYVPSNDELSPLINLHDYKNIILNDNTITFQSNTVQLNFGAISKGYIADEMKKVLQQNGVTSAILNLGGNVCTLGSKTDNSSWSVAITNPFDTSTFSASIKVTDKSVVTSGNYERYFIENGIKYHHILDTCTGYPTDNGIVSVTIIGNNGIDCDALSTACFVLGLDKSMELLESIQSYDAIIILNDGTIKTTSNIDIYDFMVISNE